MRSGLLFGVISVTVLAAISHTDAWAKSSDLGALGLMLIPVSTSGSCELLASENDQKPLVRPKPGELNVFGFGMGCPKEIKTANGTARVVTFERYQVFDYAFVGYRPNGAAMKVVRNFSVKRRGFTGYRGFRYVFYPSPNR
jgi:hypothetical protein